MKHISFNSTSFEEVSITTSMETLDIDYGPMESLFNTANALEDLFQDYIHSGVSRETFGKMEELVPAMESIDSRNKFSNTPGIKGLSLALETNVNEKKNIFRKIIDFFSKQITQFLEWIRERFAMIGEWWKKIRKNNNKPNEKVVKFVSTISKNEEAFAEAILASIPKDERDGKKEAIGKLVKAYVDEVNKKLEPLNNNLYVKYAFFNFDGVYSFISGFDRYIVDVDRILGYITVMSSAMSSSDGEYSKEQLNSALANIDKSLPNQQFFDKRVINLNTYSKHNIEFGKSDIVDFVKKSKELISNNDVFTNADNITSGFKKLENVIRKEYLDKNEESYSHLDPTIANDCVKATTAIIENIFKVIRSIQKEYFELGNISVALLTIENLLNSTIVKHTALMAQEVVDKINGDSNAVKKLMKDMVGIDVNVKTPVNTSSDLDSAIDTSSSGMGTESLNYNSFDQLDNAAFGLENMFDCDIVHHFNDCRNMTGVFAIANEANEEVKKGYIARFIGWLREFFGRIIDYVVNLCKAVKARFKPLTNKEIKVAARVTAMGPSAEDIAKTITDTVKKHIKDTPYNPPPAIVKLTDVANVEEIFEIKVGDFFKKVEENAHFHHVLTEPKKVIMFINSINNFHPLSLELATAIHTSVNADADSDVLDRQCEALETAMSNFISKTSKKLIKKDTAISSFNATFEEMFTTMESKNDKYDYNLSEAVELVKEVNVVKNKGLLDDFLKELNKIIASFNSAHNGAATANKLTSLIMDCTSFLKKYMNVYYSFLMSADLVHTHISDIVEIFEDIVSKIPEDDRDNKNLASKLRSELGIG